MFLPDFLQPLSVQDVHGLPYSNAQFTHSRSLGSSHALWWSSKNNVTPEELLIFIPGNPGLVDFYIPFLSEVHATHTSSNLAILAHAHLDHSPKSKKLPGPHSPEDNLSIQVEISLEVLDTVVSYYPKETSVVIVAHSVGCWITLQVLKARPGDIKSCLFLFPALSNLGRTPNGKKLSLFFYPFFRRIFVFLSAVMSYIPDPLLAMFFPSWPGHQRAVLRDFLSSPCCIQASLAMAHDEMRSIRGLDLDLVQNHKHRLWLFYGEWDGWVGSEKQSLLEVIDPHKTSEQVLHASSEVPHAFCISHGGPLAEQCLIWLKKYSSCP